MTRSRLDLPAPLGPITARTSPGSTVSAGTSSTTRPSRSTRIPASSMTGFTSPLTISALASPQRLSSNGGPLPRGERVVRGGGQHVDRAAMDAQLPVAVSADLEDLVHEARHLDLEVVVALGGAAGRVE